VELWLGHQPRLSPVASKEEKNCLLQKQACGRKALGRISRWGRRVFTSRWGGVTDLFKQLHSGFAKGGGLFAKHSPQKLPKGVRILGLGEKT